MYINKLSIKNIGPITELNIDFPFDKNKNPVPIIFAGENGSGKTVLLSQLIDGIYEIGNKLFKDILPTEGFMGYKYYKISGGSNLKTGKAQGFSLIQFMDSENNKLEYFDKIGETNHEDFKKFIPDFSLSPENKNSLQKKLSDINENQNEILKKDLKSGCYFYQPAYRYEEPFWKNIFTTNEIYPQDNKKFLDILGKEIEIITSTNNNKKYLLDLVLDFTINKNTSDQTKWFEINQIIQKILRRKNIRFGIGPRGGHRVSIVEQNENGEVKKQLLPSIDNLSLGESILLNLFVNIIRHSDAPPKNFNDIEGIVIVDEIDVHLNTDLQKKVLPELIKLFPKIQFIITTHSPLFLLGMKKIFGEDGFEIRNMPDGEIITTERFTEFEKAYESFTKTKMFENQIKTEVNQSTKPVLFVEGDHDIRYITKAAELLERKQLLSNIQIVDANGCGGLDSIWKHYNTKLSEITHQKILLLYDCDTKKIPEQKGKIYKQISPFLEENPIKKGVENLFNEEAIKKAREYKDEFFDFTPKIEKKVRGKIIIEPEKHDVNKDEKNNLCRWLCEKGTKDDFEKFELIFNLIQKNLLD